MEQNPFERASDESAIVSTNRISLVSASPHGAHTHGHVDCPVCEAYRKSNMRAAAFGSLHFAEASEYWLNGRRSISPNTRLDYENCIKPLTRFFGELKLEDIHIGHLQSYQDERRKTVGPIRINRELGCVLSGILDRAGLWDQVKRFYEPLPLSKKKRGIALEPEEEQHLWRVAAGNSRWSVIYYCALLARNTCLGTTELRMLRLSCIDQQEYKWLRVEEFVKNDYRERTLECNSDASWALRKLAERASKLGAKLPDHYLLPHRAETGERGADPERPQASFQWAWRQLRLEAAKKYPRLARMRFYDNRHTGCTSLMGNPSVPYNSIEHYMGHRINSQTKRIYDHMRDATLKIAAEALSSGHCEVSKNPSIIFLEQKKRAVSESYPSSPQVVKKGT